MDKKLAKQILERFYNGETTAEEECRLRDYLLNENDDSEFEPDRKLFSAVRCSERQCDVPDGFDDRLNSLIDDLENKEFVNRKRKISRLSIFVTTLSVAAVLFVVVMLFPVKNNDLELRTGPQIESVARAVIAVDTVSGIQKKVANLEVVAEAKPGVKRIKHTRKSLTKKRANEILNSAKERLAKAESSELKDAKVDKQIQKAFDKLRDAESKIKKVDEKLAKANRYI